MNVRGMTTGVLLAAAAALCGSVGSGAAVVHAQSREVDFDLIPMTAVITYAWQTAPGQHRGVFAGVGWDEFGITLKPDMDDPAFHELEQILFIGGLQRWRRGAWDVDVGVRGGLGGVRTGGDLPSPFAAVSVSALWGSRVFKFGPRLFIAQVWEFDNSDTAVHLDVITGRIILGKRER